MSRSFWVFIKLLLLCCVFLIVLPSFSLVPIQETGCDAGMHLYPSDQIEARYVDDHLVTSTRISLADKDFSDKPDVGFDLEILEGGLPLMSATETLPPDEVGLEVLLLVDITPSLLSVSPGSEESSYYYLALVWESILSLFSFTGTPEGTDWGRVAAPSSKTPFPSACKDTLFNWFVLKALPETAEMSDVQTQSQIRVLLDNWLNEESAGPRMAVILRWRETPINEDEYGLHSFQRASIVIVDVGRRFEPDAEKIREAGGQVVPLGPVPTPWPDPWSPTWSQDGEHILDHVEQNAAIVQELARRIRNVFTLAHPWQVLIDSEQLVNNLELRIRARIHDFPQCSAPLHFSPNQKGSGERLVRMINGAMFITNAAAIFIGVFYVTGLVPYIMYLIGSASEVAFQRLRIKLAVVVIVALVAVACLIDLKAALIELIGIVITVLGSWVLKQIP